MGIACCFKNRVDMCKVQLIEYDTTAATVQGRSTTLERFAFSTQFLNIFNSPFLEYLCHPLEYSGTFMAF